MVKVFLTTVFMMCFALGPGPAEAQTAQAPGEPQPDARVDAALALLEEMQFKDQMAVMRESLKPVLQQQMADLGAELGDEFTPEQQEVMDRYMAEMTEISFSEEMINEMTLDAAAVYANVFTLDEINAISEFYRTPAGVSLLAKMPEVSQQMVHLTMESQQSVMAQIAELSKAMAEELKAVTEASTR